MNLEFLLRKSTLCALFQLADCQLTFKDLARTFETRLDGCQPSQVYPSYCGWLCVWIHHPRILISVYLSYGISDVYMHILLTVEAVNESWFAANFTPNRPKSDQYYFLSRSLIHLHHQASYLVR